MSSPRTTTTTTPATTGPMTGAQASLYQQLRAHLASLKLLDAAEHLPAVLDAAAAEGLTVTAALERLLAIEVQATQARRLASRLRFACLPTPATLEDFDYDAQPGVDPHLIADLATGRYLDTATNVLMIGSPGVGKTHLAVGLARRAAESGYRPPTARSPPGERSSATPPSPPPCSTGSCTDRSSWTSAGTPTGCATTRPAPRPCGRRPPMPERPRAEQDDTTTTRPAPDPALHPDQLLCPVCWTLFTRVHRQRYCTDACRKTAWNRRHSATRRPSTEPAAQTSNPRRDVTVYACPTCHTRYHSQQWCHDCNRACDSLGLGGRCPHCDHPVALTDLLATKPHKG
jgi:hypothetical protein